MANLKQLLETTSGLTSDIEMSNESLVAQIQALDGSDDPKDRSTLSKAQAKLFSQNAGLIIKVANRYKHGKGFSNDETDELALAVFTAARKFDPNRGVNFSACLPWYIRSALQKEHAFIAGHSQSVYARNTAKVNNRDRYAVDEIAQAEEILRSQASLSLESISSQVSDNISTEDYFLALGEQAEDEEMRERMLTLAGQAIENLSDEQKEILQTMFEPNRTADEYGLRTPGAIGRHLQLESTRIEDQKQLIFSAIQDHILENEPSLQPPGWVKKEGIRLPGMEGFLMGLFGTPSADEIDNYRKVTKMGRRR